MVTSKCTTVKRSWEKKTSLISFYFTGNVEKIRDSIYRNMHVNKHIRQKNLSLYNSIDKSHPSLYFLSTWLSDTIHL